MIFTHPRPDSAGPAADVKSWIHARRKAAIECMTLYSTLLEEARTSVLRGDYEGGAACLRFATRAMRLRDAELKLARAIQSHE